MSIISNSNRFCLTVFLMINLSNTYAKRIVVEEHAQEAAVELVGTDAGVARNEAIAEANDETEVVNEEVDAKCHDEACESASVAQDAKRYGGIEQEYVVADCKVTIFNDGPIRLVDVKTYEPCDAPIPENHNFSKRDRTYQKDGCTFTETASGLEFGECPSKMK